MPGFSGPEIGHITEHPLQEENPLSIHSKRGSTRKFAAAVAVALVASVLALATPVGAKQSVSTARVSGADRYLTSTSLSTAAGLAGANATHFVLVNGTSYADALSAAALAGTKQGSIILLPADGTISASATARMAGATNVTIVGGYSALPATVETTMKTLRAAATITRISGADRYATAAAVAQAITSANVAAVNGKKSAFLASGTSFADAVIAAPGAYAGPNNSATTAVVPIMLTATDALSAPTSAQMSLLGIKQVFILGGTAVVSAAVEASVTALGITVVRLSGANRYSTATAIADKLTALTTAGGWGFDDDDIGLVNLEQSGGGADALAASAYLGQSKAPALGAGASGLATETSTWLTAHNGATGVNKIHAIGGTAAVSAAQLTAADAAGTIAGPVATVTALPGQSAAVISFSQTVTSTTASLTTGYSVFGPGSPPTVSSAAYSATTNKVTLTLSGPLQTTDIIRVNGSIIATAAGLSVAQTDYTVGYDLVKPTCSSYARTGGDTITITCNELIQVADSGAIDSKVDTIFVGGVAIAAGGVFSTKVLTVTLASGTWTSTGAAIVIPKDIFEDLAGNNNAAMSGSVITDTTKPTVVGLPTYTLTGLATAELEVGGAHTVKTLVGVGTQASVTHAGGATTTIIKTQPNLTTTGTNFNIIVTGQGAEACTVNTGTDPHTYSVTYTTGATGTVSVDTLNAIAACKAVLVFSCPTCGGVIADHADHKDISTAAMTGGVDTNLVLTAVEANTFQNVQTVAITASGGAETCTGSDTAISIGLDTAGTQTVAESITAFNADADCNRYFTMSSADTTSEQVDQIRSATASQTTTGTNDAITVRSKTAGLGGNAYQVQVVDNGAALAITYTAGTKTIVINHDVGSSAVAAATPAAIKAAMDAHATVKNLVTVTVTNNAVEMPVQAATALVGGTTRLTVSTTFSESVVASAAYVMYDMNGDDNNEVNSASTTCVGSACTSLWTLDGTTYQVVPAANSSEIQYTTGIVDLAANALVSVQPLLSSP